MDRDTTHVDERLLSDVIAKRHRPRLDEYEPIDNRWDHVVEFWDVIRPAWWPMLMTLLLCYLVLGNEQIKDVLAAMSLQHGGADTGDAGAAGLSGRFWTTLAACGVYGFIAWAFGRGLLGIRFPYTPCPFDPPAWHVVVRVMVARALGLALPISCLFSYLSMGMTREAVMYGCLAAVSLVVYLIARHYLHDWIEERQDLEEAEEQSRETGIPMSEEDAKASASADVLGDIDDALEEAEETLEEAARTRDKDAQQTLLRRVAFLAEQAGSAVRAAGNEFQQADLFDRAMPSSFNNQIRFLLYGILVFHTVMAVLFFIFPVILPQKVGAVAILFLAISGWLAFGVFAFCYWTRFLKLPPAILMFTVWLALVSQFNDNHEIARIAETGTPDFTSPDLDAYMDTWLNARLAQLPRTDNDAEFPILMVAAEGGGARAAYWTGSVLGELDSIKPASGLAPRDHIFMISGVSGGSVGAATYGASLVYEDEDHQAVSKTVQQFLTQDFLSPVTAGALYHDFFTDFIPFPLAALDRSRWLEGSWTTGWTRAASGSDLFSIDFRRLWTGGTRASLGTLNAVPLLVFNTTSVRSGSTWMVSPVRFAHQPGCRSQDFVDLIEPDGKGMSLATAAHLSARFTGISPAGRISLKGYQDCPADGFDRFVDGAYFENSGADIVAATARRLEDRIETFCFQTLNGEPQCDPTRMPIIPVAVVAEVPEPSNPPKVSHETSSILSTVANTRVARGQDSLNRLQDAGHGVMKRIELKISWPRTEEALGCAPYPDAVKTLYEGEPLSVTNRRVPLGWALSQEAVEHMCRERLSNTDLDQLKARLEGR